MTATTAKNVRNEQNARTDVNGGRKAGVRNSDVEQRPEMLNPPTKYL